MADNTSKPKSNLDSGSVLQFAFNENERPSVIYESAEASSMDNNIF